MAGRDESGWEAYGWDPNGWDPNGWDTNGWDTSGWPRPAGPEVPHGFPEYDILDTPSGPIAVRRMPPPPPGGETSTFPAVGDQSPAAGNQFGPPDRAAAYPRATGQPPIQPGAYPSGPLPAADWGAAAFLTGVRPAATAVNQFPPRAGGLAADPPPGRAPAGPSADGRPTTYPSVGYPSAAPRPVYPALNPPGPYPTAPPAQPAQPAQPNGGYPRSDPSSWPPTALFTGGAPARPSTSAPGEWLPAQSGPFLPPTVDPRLFGPPRSRPGRASTAGRRSSGDRYRSYLANERESATLYRELAAASDDEQGSLLRDLADVEDQHAAYWEEQLRLLGESFPAARRRERNTRVRFLTWLARRTGLATVLPMLERWERANAGMYDGEGAAAPGMRLDEERHAQMLAGMSMRRVSRGGIGDGEQWHRSDGSGALRAAVFGVNDGLVSNAALVLGFVGSGASGQSILLAGVAGLLAGAFSMGAGEFVSVSSQREMFASQIALEEQELEAFPEGEERELALLYQAKGLAKDRAEETAHSIMKDKKVALDTLAREELGLDPDELGSPWATAGSSALSFTAGAFVVVLPFLIGSGTAAAVAAVLLAGTALGLVGGTLSLLSGNSPRRGAVRQLIVGGLAVAAAFFIGMLLGVNMH